MATVIYLDIDDEITSAANRIRSATDDRIALVLPSGSRLATSRINFRLLAREAVVYHRSLAVVAPEGAARALAASAGLPVFTTVAEFEAAAARPAWPAGPGAGGPSNGAAGSGGSDAPAAGTAGASPFAGGAGAGWAEDAPGMDETQVVGLAGAGAAAGTGAAGSGAARPAGPGPMGSRGGPAGPGTTGTVRDQRARGAIRGVATFDAVRARSGVSPDQSTSAWEPWSESWTESSGSGRRPGRRRRRWFAGLTALASIFIVGAICAYLLLPSALVVVRAVPEPVGPLAFSVQADPLATTVDVDNGIVPAQVVTYDLAVE